MICIVAPQPNKKKLLTVPKVNHRGTFTKDMQRCLSFLKSIMVYFSYKKQIACYSKKMLLSILYWKERKYGLIVVLRGNVQIFFQSNFILGKIFSKQTFDEGLFVNSVINIEYNSLEDSFSSLKIRAP